MDAVKTLAGQGRPEVLADFFTLLESVRATCRASSHG